MKGCGGVYAVHFEIVLPQERFSDKQEYVIISIADYVIFMV